MKQSNGNGWVTVSICSICHGAMSFSSRRTFTSILILGTLALAGCTAMKIGVQKPSLIIEEYEVSLDDVGETGNRNLPSDMLSKRATWRMDRFERSYDFDALNEQLKPLQFRFKRNGEYWDLYSRSEKSVGSIKSISHFQLSDSGKRFIFYARYNADNTDHWGIFLDGKCLYPPPCAENIWVSFVGDEVLDFEEERLPGSHQIFVKGFGMDMNKISVMLGNKLIFEREILAPLTTYYIHGFYAHDRHWILEHLDVDLAGRDVVRYFPNVVLDGEDMARIHGFREIFNYIFIDDEPFYFFVNQEGKTHISYAGQVLDVEYDEVLHYIVSSDFNNNPQWNEKMVWFFAKRGGKLLYVEAGRFQGPPSASKCFKNF